MLHNTSMSLLGKVLTEGFQPGVEDDVEDIDYLPVRSSYDSPGTGEELPHEVSNDTFTDIYGVYNIRDLSSVDLQSWVDVILDEVKGTDEEGARNVARLIQHQQRVIEDGDRKSYTSPIERIIC